MRQLFIVIILLTRVSLAYCQDQHTYTISGILTDDSSGEPLIAATIYVQEDQTLGAFSDENGQYSISLKPGLYTLIINYYSYTSDTLAIMVDKNIQVNVQLKAETQTMEEIVVKSDIRQPRNTEITDMGKINISANTAEKIPAMFGETDLMKTLQLLPGVQAAGEGNTGMYVRGGGPDQNLVLMDNAPVYNTGHLFGFFSVFNNDAISDVTLYKGNIPAYYGGRISSVIDFTMKEGDYEKTRVDGGIGLIASRLTLSGPIVKDKVSFMVSGRRSYIDIITKPFTRSRGINGVPYHFYDLNGKLSWKAGEKDQFTLSGYYGRDKLSMTFYDDRVSILTHWGNATSTFAWKRIFSEKIIQKLSLIYNRYDFLAKARFDQYQTTINSGITDYTLRADYDYLYSLRHKIQFGVQYTWHTFTPQKTSTTSDSVQFDNGVANDHIYARDLALYAEDEFDINEKLRLNIGLRYNVFSQRGPYIYLTGADTIHLKKGKRVKNWDGFEPRVAARYLLTSRSSVKTAFTINNQYIHMVSLTGNSMPFDIWLPSSIWIGPQRGWQYSLGYYRDTRDARYEFSVESYYKEMKNQLEYRQDYVPSVAGQPESDLVTGRGWAYGIEFFLKKKHGDLQGWIGYTLSRTLREFPDINEGRVFPARYDRIHDLNIVATYDYGKRWTFGATFIFASGQAITLPERRYFIEGALYFQYGDRNSYRMQPYNRLDLSLTYRGKETKKFKSSWTLAVYNVYNRKNPYMYFTDAYINTENLNMKLSAKKLYLFPILPSLTWNFSF